MARRPAARGTSAWWAYRTLNRRAGPPDGARGSERRLAYPPIANISSRGRLDDVASRAGVTKGTLYLYFQSKEDLFKAVIRESLLPLLERATGELASGPEDPRERIRRVVTFLVHADTGRIAAMRMFTWPTYFLNHIIESVHRLDARSYAEPEARAAQHQFYRRHPDGPSLYHHTRTLAPEAVCRGGQRDDQPQPH